MNEENAERVSEERLHKMIAHAERQYKHAVRDDHRRDWCGPSREQLRQELSVLTELLALRAADHPAVGVIAGWHAHVVHTSLAELKDWLESGDGLAGSIKNEVSFGESVATLVSVTERLIAAEPLTATGQAGGEVVGDDFQRGVQFCLGVVDKVETAAREKGWEDEATGAIDVREAILSASPPSPAATQSAVVSGPTHRHVKRGSEYVLLGMGKMQAEDWRDLSGEQVLEDGAEVGKSVDMREVAIYRSIADGSLWVRPREEFEDALLAALSNPGASQ